MKKVLALLTAAVLAVSGCFILAACDGNTPQNNANETEGPTGGVEKTPEPGKTGNSIVVADKGVSEFKFVIGDVADHVPENAVLVSEKLGKKGVAIPVAEEGEKPARSIIVETSEDYRDPEGGVLSFEGFRIVEENGNLRITGGNIESTVSALEYFADMFKEGSLTIEEGFEYNSHPFKKAEGLKVAGVSVGEFRIVPEAGDTLQENAAKYIKKLLFTNAGVFVKDDPGAEHTVTFKYGADDSAKGCVAVENGNIVVTGNKKIGFYRVFRDFLEARGGSDAAEGSVFETDYGEFITYEEFGASGDGKTDDSKAIYDAHTKQKDTGLKILADEDATYYFGKSAKLSKITADVDWSTAHFIIDDSELKGAGNNIFSIPSENKSSSIKKDLSKAAAGATNLGVTFASKTLVTLVNDGVKQYIRKGANQDSGSSQKEIILVDPDGSVDPGTPIIWDYKKLTSATAIAVNDGPLTVRGGIFTTIANRAASNYTYYNRGIEIQRSNAVIKEIAHYITGEGETGAPYNGFLMISNTNELTVKDTVLTPHYTYYTMGSGGVETPMGSYDCQVTNTVNLHFINVIQSKSISDIFYWGTFASNYSRNIEFDGCVIGRFDAHKGVYNVTLKNSSFGHQGINLIGHGEALIENCRIYGKTLINLRDDYGSTWDGDIIIRNCVYYPLFGIASMDASVIGGTNTFDHDFGYTCMLPKNIVIDGLYVNDSDSLTGAAPTVFGDINPNWNSENYKAKYPMVMTENIKVKGFESYSGKALEVSSNTYMFGNLKIDFQ